MPATKKKQGKPKAEETAPLRLEWRTPAELAENPLNWRRHPESQIAALTGVIAEVGWAGACLLNERTGHLIDGHARKKVALEQGTEKVPVLVGSWTEEQERKILATLDPLAAMAEADQAALDALLRSVQTGEAAVADMLTKLAEENGIVPENSGTAEDGPVPIDRAAELQEKWQTATGQLWRIGEHRLVIGDSEDERTVSALLAGHPISLIVTSPPYNQNIDQFRPSGMHKEGGWVAKVEKLAYADSLPEEEYQRRQAHALSVWYEALPSGASVFYNHKNRYRDKQVISPLRWLPGPFKFRQEIVWSRPGSVTQNARMFLPSDERIYWLYKGDDFFFDDATEIKNHSTVWDIGLQVNTTHPVAFPVELPSRCIQACSKPGQWVFEPYCGSGTTIVACQRLSRRCLAIEADSAFVAVCLERLALLGLEPQLTVEG